MRYKHCLNIEFINSDNTTKLIRSFSTGAIRVVKPFYIGDTLVLQIISLGAGICSYDTVEINISVGEACKVILINQSATKILTSYGNERSENHININVGQYSTLEFYSGLIIPFPESELVQSIDVNLSRESKFGYLEILSSGRIEKGEDFLFRNISSNFLIKREKRLIFWENYSIKSYQKNNMAILGKYRYLCTGIWTYELSDDIRGLEEFDNGLLVWGRNHHGLTFIRGVARDGHLLIRNVCDLVDKLKREKKETVIPWQSLSSAFL